MTALLVIGIAAVALWIAAKILGQRVRWLLVHITLYLYSPPRGYVVLPLTWVAVVATWQFIVDEPYDPQPNWLVFPVLGLAWLGSVGILILRDGLRNRRRPPALRSPNAKPSRRILGRQGPRRLDPP